MRICPCSWGKSVGESRLVSFPHAALLQVGDFRSVELEHYAFSAVQGVPAHRYRPSPGSMQDVALQKAMGFCNPNTPAFFNDTSIQQRQSFIHSGMGCSHAVCDFQRVAHRLACSTSALVHRESLPVFLPPSPTSTALQMRCGRRSRYSTDRRSP